jgi:hypothetical protein
MQIVSSYSLTNIITNLKTQNLQAESRVAAATRLSGNCKVEYRKRKIYELWLHVCEHSFYSINDSLTRLQKIRENIALSCINLLTFGFGKKRKHFYC